jgi:uncharacterized protein involved in exopolysaccharide biosynthesis
MQDQPVAPVQIRAALYILKKHKWKILTIFLLAVITVGVATLMVRPIYQATSQLLVKPGREDVYVSPTGGSPAVIDYSEEAERVHTEIAILGSLNLRRELVDGFGADRLFQYPDRTLKGKLFETDKKRKIPPIQQVHKLVEKSLLVSAIPRSNVIKVAFEWPDPVIAASVVNTLVDLYLAKHIEVHTDPQTYSLLENQLTKWDGELRESEMELAAFKDRHSITSLPEQRTIYLKRLSDAESQRRQTETEIHETTELVAMLEAQLTDLDQSVQLQEEVDKTSETLATLKAKLVDLELQGLKDEINQVKKMIAEEEKKEQVVVVSGKSPIRQNLEGDLLKAKARLGALKAKEENQKSQVSTYREQLKTLDGFEKQLKDLERQVAIDEANFKLYLTRFEEARISENMDKQRIANVRIIEAAVPVMKPVRPRKRLNVLLGGFFGLFLGIGAAFLIEVVHPVFRTREDVDQFLGLPVLAILPKEK